MIPYILTQQDISYCRKAIQELDDDGNGQISVNDLQTVFQRMDIHYQQFQLCRLISQLDQNNQGYIEFQSILQLYKQLKTTQLNSQNDQDTLDAYTAIGGPADKSGHIDEKVLIKIINQQFQLPIDMEQLIKSVDDSCNGQIQYQQFQRMLKDSPINKDK